MDQSQSSGPGPDISEECNFFSSHCVHLVTDQVNARFDLITFLITTVPGLDKSGKQCV